MAKLVLTLAGERYDNGNGDCGWKLVRYSHIADFEDGDRVRDIRYLNGISERLCDPTLDSSWINSESDATKRKFFDIYLIARNHGKDNAEYKLDYHTYCGCPSQVIAEGMEIYRIIRTEGVRPCMDAVRRNREMAKGKVKAKFAGGLGASVEGGGRDQKIASTGGTRQDAASTVVGRFDVGGVYEAVGTDSFGHILRENVIIESVERGRGLIVFSKGEGKKAYGAKIQVGESGVESFRHKALCGIVKAER